MSSEDTPSRLADPGDAVRSGFLVHWIGRDIHQADGHDNTPCDWSVWEETATDGSGTFRISMVR